MDIEYKIHKPILNGVLIFIWTLILKLLTGLFIYAYSVAKNSPMRDIPNWGIHLIAIAAFFFIYNSVLRLITLFNQSSRDEYLLLRESDFKFTREIAKIIKSKDFVIESIVSITLFTISCFLGAFVEAGSLILGDGTQGTAENALISAAVIVPLCLIIGIFCRYEVRRYWISLEEKNELDKISSPLGLLWRAILISIAYPVLFPFFPLLLFVIFNIFNILFTLFDAISIIGVLLVAVLLFILIYLAPLLSGMKKRKKFLKELKKVCSSTGFKLSNLKNPYKSFFKPKIEANFLLSRGEERYECAFVSTLHKSTWLYFVSDTDAYFRHRIGTKNHHFTINHHIEYGIRGSGKKFIIISPLPKHIFAESDGASREILPGDKIWDYVIYNMSGFINAIDRNCLDKYNSSGE